MCQKLTLYVLLSLSLSLSLSLPIVWVVHPPSLFFIRAQAGGKDLKKSQVYPGRLGTTARTLSKEADLHVGFCLPSWRRLRSASSCPSRSMTSKL